MAKMENPVKGLRDQVDGHVSEGRQRVMDLETVAGWRAAPTKTCPTFQLLEPETLTLHGNRCDSVRTSAVRRLSGILWVGPKCKHEPPSKTEAEGDLSQKRRPCGHRAESVVQPPEAGGSREQSPPEPPEGVQP